MAAWVIKNKKSEIYPRIILKHGQASELHFYAAQPLTQSAVAVPLRRSPGSSEVFGVFILESPSPFCFSTIDLVELENEVHSIAVYSSFLEHYYARPWAANRFFPRADMSLASVRDRLLEKMVEALGENDFQSAAVTLWEQNRHDGTAIALSSVGYDTEFTRQRTLPIAKVSCETHEPISFVGYLMGSGENSCTHGNWRSLPAFRGHDKAIRSELLNVHGVGFSIFGDLASCTMARPCVGCTGIGGNENALTFYTFDATPEIVEDFLASDDLSHTATKVAEFLRTACLQMIETVTSELLAKFHERCLAGDTAFSIAQQFFMDSLEIDGFSVFSLDKQRTLQLKSTSGLTSFGKPVFQHQEVQYKLTLPVEGDHDQGLGGFENLTTEVMYSRRSPSGVKRVNIINASSRSPTSPRRYVESYVLSENEHRKSLILAVRQWSSLDNQPNIDGRVGVIRCVRANSGRHFSESDERIAKALCTVLEPVFGMHQLEIDLESATRKEFMSAVTAHFCEVGTNLEKAARGSGDDYHVLRKDARNLRQASLLSDAKFCIMEYRPRRVTATRFVPYFRCTQIDTYDATHPSVNDKRRPRTTRQTLSRTFCIFY